MNPNLISSTKNLMITLHKKSISLLVLVAYKRKTLAHLDWRLLGIKAHFSKDNDNQTTFITQDDTNTEVMNQTTEKDKYPWLGS